MTYLIDQNKGGATGRSIPLALIRFNTQAETGGNATARLRLSAPNGFVVDWGDTNIERIDSAPLEGGTGSYYVDHTYAAPGIYNAILSTIGSRTGNIRLSRNNLNDVSAPSPKNLVTRIQYLRTTRVNTWSQSFKNAEYLQEVVLPAGEKLGSVSLPLLEECFAGCPALTSLPPIDLVGVTNINGLFQGYGSAPNPVPTLANWLTVTEFVVTWRGANITSFPAVNFSGAGQTFFQTWAGCTAMTSFGLCQFGPAPLVQLVWAGCSGLTSFPLIDFSSFTGLDRCWEGCTGLTSFPAIDCSSVQNFTGAWNGCSGLTSFPLLDFSSATSLETTWGNCSGLTAFPAIDTSNVSNFVVTWEGCSGLVTMPLLDTSSATSFLRTWRNCTSLANFPAGMFDNTPATYFGGPSISEHGPFEGCTALTQTSINNIYISINTAGTSNGYFRARGGVIQPDGAGTTARTAMISRGWTIDHP